MKNAKKMAYKWRILIGALLQPILQKLSQCKQAQCTSQAIKETVFYETCLLPPKLWPLWLANLFVPAWIPMTFFPSANVASSNSLWCSSDCFGPRMGQFLNFGSPSCHSGLVWH